MKRITQNLSWAALGLTLLLMVGPRSLFAAPQAKLATLGHALFFDTNLSQPRGQACASCHNPERGFSGNLGSGLGVAPGAVPGRVGARNVPSAMYAAFVPPLHFVELRGESRPIGGLFLDGRAPTLEEQAKGPLFNPNEMNLADPTMLVQRVRESWYADEFRAAFGLDVFSYPEQTLQGVAEAIAAFERQLAPFNSRFDEYRRKRVVFTNLERRGLELFKDSAKGNCVACHSMDDTSIRDSDNLFTDFSYDNLGVPRNPRIPANADAGHFDLGLCPADRPDLCGSFRVPTLRNVSRREAFFHNGSIATLREAVLFYATREVEPWRWYPGGQKYNDLPACYQANVNSDELPYRLPEGGGRLLEDEDVDALVAFLKTLEDR